MGQYTTSQKSAPSKIMPGIVCLPKAVTMVIENRIAVQ